MYKYRNFVLSFIKCNFSNYKSNFRNELWIWQRFIGIRSSFIYIHNIFSHYNGWYNVIIINWVIINNIWYVVDTGLVTDNRENLLRLINHFDTVSNYYGSVHEFHKNQIYGFFKIWQRYTEQQVIWKNC